MSIRKATLSKVKLTGINPFHGGVKDTIKWKILNTLNSLYFFLSFLYSICIKIPILNFEYQNILYKSNTPIIYYYYAECQINDISALSYFNQAIIKSNIAAKEEHT
jgi:hypothetical protein